VLSCQPSQNAVGYQLLMGPDPYDMEYLISDTPNPPENVISIFPCETTYWTIKARDQYGSTIYADPICVKVADPAKLIPNPFGPDYLDLIGYELVWKKRISQTEFEYCFRMKVKNMSFHAASKISVELSSTPDNISVLNDKVLFGPLPFGQEVLSEDTFTVRIDHSMAANETDLVWQISGEHEPYLAGDIDYDFAVGLTDIEIFAGNWLGSYLHDGLEGYWALGDTAGSIIGNLSGNGSDGILVGTPEYADGVAGKALLFDGIDDYMAVDNFSITGNEFTFVVWMKGSGPLY
ncbi:unnamed protein product, partial [marine sediment metagenome]